MYLRNDVDFHRPIILISASLKPDVCISEALFLFCIIVTPYLKRTFRPAILLKKWFGMVHQLLLSDFINVGIHESFKALNIIIFVSVMRIPLLLFVSPKKSKQFCFH